MGSDLTLFSIHLKSDAFIDPAMVLCRDQRTMPNYTDLTPDSTFYRFIGLRSTAVNISKTIFS